MISKSIYLFTMKRIIRTPALYFVGLMFAVGVPVSTALSPAGSIGTAGESLLVYSYSCTILFGLALAIGVNIFSNASAQGGKTDCLPLLLTRPLKRSTYVLTKWIVLASAIAVVSFVQQTLLFLYAPHPVPLNLVATAFLERTLDIFSISAVLVLIISLPSRNMIAWGIIALEIMSLWAISAQLSLVSPGSASGESQQAMDGLMRVQEWLTKNTIQPFIPFDAFTGKLVGCGLYVLRSLIGPRTFAFDVISAQPINLLPWLIYGISVFGALSLAITILDHRDVNYAIE